MACTTPFLSLRLAAGSVLIALGHPLERLGFELCGIALLVAGMLLFTAWLGVFGLVLAVIVSEITMSLLGTVLVMRCVKQAALV